VTPGPGPAADDVRAPLILQITQLRRRIAWLQAKLEERDPEAADALPPAQDRAEEARNLDVGTLLDTYGAAASDVMQTLLEHVRTDARLDAVEEFAAEHTDAMAELVADERSLAAVSATLEQIRAAARRQTQSPPVAEALSWAVGRLEAALIAAGPVLEETLAAERDRALTAAVEKVGLDGIAAAAWVAEVNGRIDAVVESRQPG
jgi:DNA repair exonuclease SbcCD ATPase subunit